MRQVRVITWPLRIAIVAIVVAATAVAVAGWGAIHRAEIPRMGVPTSDRGSSQLGSYRPALVSEIDRAIEVDPFHPERRRPQIRYELRRPSSGGDPETPAPAPEKIELIGTVVAPGGRSFAMCQTSAGPQLVHIGETFAGFTLKSVEQGSAVFVSPAGKRMTVLVKKTGS